MNQSVWEVMLEDPRAEEGTIKYTFTLGEKATEEDVRYQLLRIPDDDGTPIFYEENVYEPWLHYIRKLN